MKTRKLHSWNLSYARARQLQVRLAGEVQFTPLRRRPEVVAGLDCAFSKDGGRIVAAVVVLQLPGFEVLETAEAIRKVTFPYIPGLLSFREAPACIAAVEKLRKKPDLFIVDGQGVAHPRRLGLAAHLGLFFDRPTIGCAKSRLIGVYEEPPLQKGSYSWLTDPSGKRSDLRMTIADCRLKIANRKSQIANPIGAVVRTRTNVKPLFVSVGNKCTLDDAIEITLACTTTYRLPEPTRLAHQLVSRLKAEA
jgi:deoxyribonuclease V